MALEKTLEFRLRWFDFDRFGHIQPTTVLDLFQDLAIIHGQEMGIGWSAMQEKGVFWALVRLRYRVKREPDWGAVVTVRSWPHSPSKISFQRDYTIYDDQGEELIIGTSEWVLIDVESRRFARMADVYPTDADFIEERNFPDKPKKLKPLDVENLPPYQMEARFPDIDINGHVNNSRYPRFVLDAWNPAEPFAIREMQVDFRQEVPFGASLNVHSSLEGKTLAACGLLEDGAVAFNCSMELA